MSQQPILIRKLIQTCRLVLSRAPNEHFTNSVISSSSWLVVVHLPNGLISVVREPVSDECVVEGEPRVEGLALSKCSTLDDLIRSLVCRVSRNVNEASVSRHKGYIM